MTPFYTALALTAFAANSLLCRLALGGRTIDAASFTTIRLVSGAIVLMAISRLRAAENPPRFGGASPLGPGEPPPRFGAASPLGPGEPPPRFGAASPLRPAEHQPGVGGAGVSVSSANAKTRVWRSAVALFAYAIAFSFAYLSLTTGTGALILFGAVQTTMIVHALASGERPHALEWLGLAAAVTGLVVLVFPGLTSPPFLASLVMSVSGMSWGFYSLWGRGTHDPLAATTANFVRSVPLAVAVSLLALGGFHASARGALLAAASGAFASGLGYVVWYAALRGMTATRAAIVQSATPVLTAIGGVVFLSEQISIRLVTAAVLILGGIGAATAGRR